MHTTATEVCVASTRLRHSLDLGISNNVLEMETNQQMPGRNCTNNQQRRGRRRRRARTHYAAGGRAGIFCWSINLAILICLAHSTNAGKCCPSQILIKCPLWVKWFDMRRDARHANGTCVAWDASTHSHPHTHKPQLKAHQ